jgi:hypothetical protein
MARALEAEAKLANARAENSDLLARNALLELQAEKMRRAMYGARSERSERLIDQMELAFAELEETAAEDERLAQIAADKTTTVQGFCASARHAAFPTIYPVSALSLRHLRIALAAVRMISQSSARRSPARSRKCRRA